MIRIGFWDPLYYNHNKEPPKIVLVIFTHRPQISSFGGSYLEFYKVIPFRPLYSGCRRELLFLLAPSKGFLGLVGSGSKGLKYRTQCPGLGFRGLRV